MKVEVYNMESNAMFVDYWEEFNTKRVEFRKLMKKVIQEAYDEGKADGYFGGDSLASSEYYAEEKIKELF